MSKTFSARQYAEKDNTANRYMTMNTTMDISER